MTIKYICDHCKREYDEGNVFPEEYGKHICADCLKVRIWDMTKRISETELSRYGSEAISLIYLRLADCIAQLNVSESHLTDATHPKKVMR